MLPLPPAIVLQVTRADVTRMLRVDALHLGLGLLLLAVGVAAVAVYARTLRRKEPSLPWFGLFAFIYGLRLLTRTDTFPLFFSLPPAFWDYLGSALTYVIPLPAVGFLRAAFPRWRRPLGLGGHLRRGVRGVRPRGRRRAAAARVGADAQQPDRHRVHDRFPGAPIPARVASWPRLANVARRCHQHRGDGGGGQPAGTRGQASILPGSMPSVAGLSVAARYQPMTAVAGDFYDFLEMGDRRLGVLVADVSGHGVPAALIASMVKVAIAAQKPQADRPAAVLAGMNETLRGQLGGQYVTAAYLFLDREAGVMRYSAAGHPPLLRWRPDEQQICELEENGLPLGLMDVADYQQLERPLKVGDRLLLYTDGLVDATNAAGEFFGVERVKAAVAASAGLSTEGVADLILEKTRGWADGTAADDLTLVLVDCV